MHPIKPILSRIASAALLLLSFYSLSSAQSSSKSHTGWLRSYTLSASNKYLITVGTDGQLGVWDYSTGKPLIFFPAHEKVIADVVINPKDQFFFSIDESGLIKKWELPSGKLLLQFQGHEGKNTVKPQYATYFRNDSHVENLTKNKVQFPTEGMLTPRLAVHANGYLLSGGQDTLVKLWDSNTGKLLWSKKEHSAPILAVGISPDGKNCVTYAKDKVLKVWSTRAGQLLNSRNDASSLPHPISFSATNQNFFVVASNSISSWSLPDLKETTVLKSRQIRGMANGVMNQELFYQPTLDSVILYQLDQKNISKKFNLEPHYSSLTIDKQGRLLFLDKTEKLVQVFDPQKASLVHTFGVFRSNIQSLKFSPQGKYLLLNDEEQQIVAMDWSNPASIPIQYFPLQNPDRIHHYAVDDQDQNLLSGSSEGNIVVWDLASAQSQAYPQSLLNAVMDLVWIKGTTQFAAWDYNSGTLIYTGKRWLRAPRGAKSVDEAAIRQGKYVFQTPLSSYFYNGDDLFLSSEQRSKLKKYKIYKHVGEVKPLFNRDTTKMVYVAKDERIGFYDYRSDQIIHKRLPVKYASWVGDQSRYLFVVEETQAYIRDMVRDEVLLQYIIPKSSDAVISPAGAHFILLTPDQNLEIREIFTGKRLATVSWKRGAAAVELSFNTPEIKQWAQLQAILNQPTSATVQQQLDQLNPHLRYQSTGIDAIVPHFGLPSYRGSLGGYDPLILEYGDVVFQSEHHNRSGRDILYVYNLPTAQLTHTQIQHSSNLRSNGQSFYSHSEYGESNALYDHLGNYYAVQNQSFDMDQNGGVELCKDKKYLGVIDKNGAIVIWHIRLQKVKHLLKGSSPFLEIKFDERDSLVIAHTKKDIELYDLESGKKIFSIPVTKEINRSFTFHFSPNSRYLAYINTDIKISVWDLKTLQETVVPIKVGKIIGLSDISNKIAVFEVDNQVSVYDIKGGERRFTIDLNLGYGKKNGRYFPEIEKIVVADQSGRINVLDVNKGSKLMTIYTSSNNEWVALANNGLHFETNTNGIQQVKYRTTTGEIKSFNSIDTTYYKKGMVTTAFTGLPKVVDLEAFPATSQGATPPFLNYLKWYRELNAPISLAPRPKDETPKFPIQTKGSLHFLGENLLFSQTDQQTHIIEKSTGRILKSLPVGFDFISPVVNKTQNQLLFINHQKSIIQWNLNVMDLTKACSFSDILVSALAISPDYEYLFVGCSDGKIRSYKLQSFQLIETWDIGKFNILSLTFSNNGQHLLAVDSDNTAYLYEFKSNQLYLQYSLTVDNGSSEITTRFNQDDSMVLINSRRDKLRVIDLKTKTILLQKDQRHVGQNMLDFFDPVDPKMLYYRDGFQMVKVDLKTGRRVDSIDRKMTVLDYLPSKRQLLVNDAEKEVIVDLPSRTKTPIQDVRIQTPKILYIRAGLQKFYYRDPLKPNLFHEYDWVNNIISNTLEHTAYLQNIEKERERYTLNLKKDSILIFDNYSDRLFKGIPWKRTIPNWIKVSQTGRYLAYVVEDSNTTEILDLNLNKVVHTLPIAAHSYSFSLSDRYLLVNNPNGHETAVIELATFKRQDLFPYHSSYDIESVGGEPNENFALLYFHEQSNYQYINLKTGQSLGCFYFFVLPINGTPEWVFIATNGFFDGTPGGIRQLYHVDTYTGRSKSLNYQTDPKYQPGLLQKLLK